jgi:type IV secretory pathway VirB10-like protein
MKQGLTSRVVQLTAVCTALACSVAAGATEVHRWVDENGVVHFSDVRPNDAPASTLELADPAPAPAVNATAVTGAGDPPPSAAEQKRQEIRERREAQAAEREETATWCDKHRTRLEQMEPARRVFYTDENGEQVRMDDDMRMGLIEESKTFLSENCQ